MPKAPGARLVTCRPPANAPALSEPTYRFEGGIAGVAARFSFSVRRPGRAGGLVFAGVDSASGIDVETLPGGGEPSAVKSDFCSAKVLATGSDVSRGLFMAMTLAVQRSALCSCGRRWPSVIQRTRRRLQWLAKAAPPHTRLKPDTGVAMTQSAHITGTVEYRQGDGANITIRPGPCDIDVTALDATISWTDGDSHGSTAIPIDDFRRHLASKAIQLDAAAAT
jgi:hypothetical protein